MIVYIAGPMTGFPDLVALLPGWVNSRGALLERRIATALGLLVGAVADFLGEAS